MISRAPGWTLFAAVVALSGCGSPNYMPPPPSDASVAQTALQKALDCWKLRVDPSELRAANPPITLSDEDWDAQHRLLEYQLLPGERPAGSTIRWPVRLKVTRQNGQEVELDVVYVISTNPIIHIGRQD